MFCTNCGRQIDDTAKFCDYCGTPVSDTDDAAPAQDRISTSPAAPQITVPASKPAGSGKVVTKRYHKPAIIVIVIIAVVAAAVIAIVAGLESHWNKKGDRAIETVQNSYFEFLPDITVVCPSSSSRKTTTRFPCLIGCSVRRMRPPKKSARRSSSRT